MGTSGEEFRSIEAAQARLNELWEARPPEECRVYNEAAAVAKEQRDLWAVETEVAERVTWLHEQLKRIRDREPELSTRYLRDAPDIRHYQLSRPDWARRILGDDADDWSVNNLASELEDRIPFAVNQYMKKERYGAFSELLAWVSRFTGYEMPSGRETALLAVIHEIQPVFTGTEGDKDPDDRIRRWRDWNKSAKDRVFSVRCLSYPKQ